MLQFRIFFFVILGIVFSPSLSTLNAGNWNKTSSQDKASQIGEKEVAKVDAATREEFPGKNISKSQTLN